MNKTRTRSAFLMLAAALVLLGITPPILNGVAGWLVHQDPLQPARAAVVFGGHLPFAAIEAASIFRLGLVAEVWLTRGATHEEEDALDHLGIHTVAEHDYSRQVLEKLGVPAAAIRLLDTPVDNTAEEVKVIAAEAHRAGG